MDKIALTCRAVEISCLVLSDQVPFHSGQVRNLFTCPGTSIKKVVNLKAILYLIFDNYDEHTCCRENSVDPDQLASPEARKPATLFSIEFISGFIMFLKELIYMVIV